MPTTRWACEDGVDQVDGVWTPTDAVVAKFAGLLTGAPLSIHSLVFGKQQYWMIVGGTVELMVLEKACTVKRSFGRYFRFSNPELAKYSCTSGSSSSSPCRSAA